MDFRNRMNMKWKISLLTLMFPLACLAQPDMRGTFELSGQTNSEVTIIVPDTSNSIIDFAAKELKKHLDMVLENNIEIAKFSIRQRFKKCLFVGIRDYRDKDELLHEEARYMVDTNCIYFYGDDQILKAVSSNDSGEFKDRVLNEALDLLANRTGTLFSVYWFLENELGIRWTKPGDEGIFHTKRKSVLVRLKTFKWIPELKQRHFRPLLTRYDQQVLYGQYAPKEFKLDETTAIKNHVETVTWLRRMRMGRSEQFKFGHAFGEYWTKYHDSNPAIFALTIKGERKPMGRIERIKMCPSNNELPKLIVNEWLGKLKNNSYDRSYSISGCENDSDGFGSDDWCHCGNCKTLDSLKDGEDMEDFVTDRYVYLWNSILREVNKIDKKVKVSGYAYENMLLPPRKQTLDSGLLIGFIPRMGGDFTLTDSLYKEWKRRGMMNMMFRPNDLWWEMGIPMGQEQRIFQNFKLAIKYNAIGTDFDGLQGFWHGISDITYYVLAKGQISPDAGFEELEREFVNSFGDAKNDISMYYKYWRDKFNDKIIREELKLNDRINSYFFEWQKLYRLTSRIDEFYSLDDFDKTDRYLKNAMRKNLTPHVRNYIRKMYLVNRHSRLTFESMMVGKSGSKSEIISSCKKLIKFRKKHRLELGINWNVLFMSQYFHMKDQIGTRYLKWMSKNIDTSGF